MQELKADSRIHESMGDKPFFHFQGLVLGRWLDGVMVLLGAVAFCATIVLMLRLVNSSTESVRWALAVSAFFLAGLIVLLLRRRVEEILQYGSALLAKTNTWKILVTGLMLRALWVFVFPAKPSSDGVVYVSLAKGLLDRNIYEIAGTFAYWPAGYPLILAAWQYILPGDGTGYILLNFFLFVVMFWGVVLLTTELAGKTAGRWAGLAIALWPNYITAAATPEKELAVAALLPWCVYILVRIVSKEKTAVWLPLGCGCLLGISTLVQPSLQLLVPVMMVFLLFAKFRPAAGRAWFAVLILVGASSVVLPWTYRNYAVFGEFVLVSTNGGSNLYRANNALATGGYTERGEVDLSNLNELTQDREGKRLAKEWILSNPYLFAKLALEKQVRFLGDDATGVYTTLKVGGASNNTLTYVALKAAANLWWMLAWLLLMLLILTSKRRQGSHLDRIPIWFFLYLFSLHSVFESVGKYHMPVLWVLPCMLAIYMTANDARAIQRN